MPTRSLHDLLHCLEVIGLYLQVGDRAVTLRRGDRRVSQEVLDRAKVSPCIQHLRGHGMAQVMARGIQGGLARMMLNTLLHAAYR